MGRDDIADDMVTLSRVGDRHAGSEGERAVLHAIRERLPDGVASRIEGFVAYTSPSFIIGFHAMSLVIGGVVGLWWPALGALWCGAITLSLLAEGTGQISLLRWVLPKSASYNLVVPPVVVDAEPALGTLVISAPVDTPRWRPETPSWMRRPLRAVVVAALVVTGLLVLRSLAEPWGRPSQGLYTVSLIVLGATVLIGTVAHRRTAGVGEDASGPAVLIELTRRLQARPIPGVQVWLVFTGCGHAYQNGMHAFLAMWKNRHVDPVFVLTLDEPARAPVGAVVSEGTLRAEPHRPTGPALVERLRWAGVRVPDIDKAGVTDARAALRWGYRALALAGGDGPANATTALQAADVAETLSRWYGEDLARVADERSGLSDLATATHRPRPPKRRRRGLVTGSTEADEPAPSPPVSADSALAKVDAASTSVPQGAQDTP